MTPKRSSDRMASIDLGSHTARLLVAGWEAGRLHGLLRKRAYTRLAEDFESPEAMILKPAAIERALEALEEFRADIERTGARTVKGIATGVVRAAANRNRFIDLVREKTGIPIEIVSGEEEARLTGLGIRHGLQLGDRPFTAFDLGGGTTEFLRVPGQGPFRAVSLPLGAMILTQRHLFTDPPARREIENLKKEAREVLFSFLDAPWETMLVGTGGTVTTLAAMVHGMGGTDIRPERMNGLSLRLDPLEALLARLEKMTVAERSALPGLDPGRAGVLPAGGAVVTEILHFFHCSEMMVSLSDLLEGTLLDLLGVFREMRSF